MTSDKPLDTLILDAGPLLKNEPSVDTLLAKANHLITTSSVVNEIRDRNARQRIETQLLPFIKLQSPRFTNLEFVSSFAKKTGDFSVLSRTDLEILALTYELEVERNGEGHLRKSPQNKPMTKAPAKSDKVKEETNEAKDEVTSPRTNQDPTASGDTAEQTVESVDKCQDVENLQIGDDRLDQGIEVFQNEAEPKPPPIEQTPPPIGDDSDSDNSDGWITPSNLRKHQEKTLQSQQSTTTSPQPPQIACITSDFAMQNVLLQIGLNLLSPSLTRIRTLKTFILRCHACFHQDHDTSKQFCPRCGKPTLTRVSCSTDSKGVFRVHLKKNMEWHHKGDRYSIPKPVHGSASGKQGNVRGGGRGGWGRDLVLAEDQKEYVRAVGGVGGKEKKARDLMDEDYLPSILTGKREKPGGRPKVGAGRNVNSRKRRE